MGLFGRNIEQVYAARGAGVFPQPPAPALAISSPWSPQDSLVTFALDALAAADLAENARPMSADLAMRVPGIARAHGIHVTEFAQIPFYAMNDAARAAVQPEWLTNSRSGVAPYQRMFGLGSDLFFYGWAALGFTSDMTDCLHIPYGLWKISNGIDDAAPAGVPYVTDPDRVPREYSARVVVVNLGYRQNGVLADGQDTINAAYKIEDAYQRRLDDPVPLTILNIPLATWEQWTPEERQSYLKQWVDNRRKSSTALKVAEFPVEMPGQVAVDLYESGRNANRLDIANHTSTPASILEGVHQGGSGSTEMNYNGVENGATRSELWDYGLAKRMMLAFEARMSLDDIVPSGISIRGDRSAYIAAPTPPTSPTRED